MKQITTRSLMTLAASAILALTVSGTAMAASLVGAGSTLVAPFVAKWSAGFKASTGVSVTYGAVGSGTGIADITSRTVDFGASDAPMTAAQASACNSCVEIPWALSATGLAYNLSGIGNLKLSGPVIADIYLGTITTWNNPAIAALNKGVTLPNEKITPVFRSDGSGDTYAFTNYLTQVSPTFLAKVGPPATQVNFPTGTSGKGNAGVAAVISSTQGAIGYASAFYIRDDGLTEAAIQNAAGNFEYAYIPNIEDAADLIKTATPNAGLSIVNPKLSTADKTKAQKIKDPAYSAYPLSTFTYVIVPTAPSQAPTIKAFINYALSPAGQAFGPALTFAPLPAVVLAEDKKEVAAL